MHYVQQLVFVTGAEMVQETKVVVTNSAQIFHWEGYGLKLEIPQNSLHEKKKRPTISIKASL